MTLEYGPYSRTHYAHEFSGSPQNGPITGFTIHAGDALDGIEMIYGGHAEPLRGGRGGSPHSATLEPDETIVHGRVAWGDSIDGLYFRTSKGRTLGGGKDGGPNAAPPEEVNARLIAVGGTVSNRSIEGLTLKFQYDVVE